jgi:hypothetical protein
MFSKFESGVQVMNDECDITEEISDEEYIVIKPHPSRVRSMNDNIMLTNKGHLKLEDKLAFIKSSEEHQSLKIPTKISTNLKVISKKRKSKSISKSKRKRKFKKSLKNERFNQTVNEIVSSRERNRFSESLDKRKWKRKSISKGNCRINKSSTRNPDSILRIKNKIAFAGRKV